MENIKVSVIIPVYNTEKYLEEAINSIINQTLREIEIIIVNDGSTDNSAKILADFVQKDCRIKILTHEKNKGTSVARNTGLDIAKGEYIYFFDSDDVLENDCLELCYKKMNDSDYDFLIFDRKTFYENKQKPIFKLQKRHTDFLDKDFYTGTELLTFLYTKKAYNCSVCFCFIKKTYLDKLNLKFLPGVLFEDDLFSIQLYLSAKKITFIKRDFFHRRVRFNSTMTQNISQKIIDSRITICHEIIKLKKTYTNKQCQKLLNLRVRGILLFQIKTLIRSRQLGLLLKNCFVMFKMLFKTLFY